MADDPVSRLNVGALPDLCQEPGSKLRRMTGLFRQWLICHFSAPETIANPAKKQVWVWRQGATRGEPDKATTGIVIEPNTKFAKMFTEDRPAVVIKRNKWSKNRVGINNQFLGAVGPEGRQYFATYYVGSHTLFCVSREPVEAELLAEEVQGEVTQFGPAVQRRLGLFRLEVAEVDEIGILEESGQSFVVPVTVAYAVEERWVLRKDAPFFNRFDLALMGL